MLDTKIKHEPSMEEILQTIRKVVSQDMSEEKIENIKNENEEDILELTQEIQEDGSVVEVQKKQSDIIDEIDSVLENAGAEKNVYDETKEEKTVEPSIQEAPKVEEEVKIVAKAEAANTNTEHLISEKTAEISRAAIQNLINTASKPLSDGLSFRSGMTVEELIIEAIRPQLSGWLDKNLPGIVQNIVEKEIKHILPKNDE